MDENEFVFLNIWDDELKVKIDCLKNQFRAATKIHYMFLYHHIPSGINIYQLLMAVPLEFEYIIMLQMRVQGVAQKCVQL